MAEKKQHFITECPLVNVEEIRELQSPHDHAPVVIAAGKNHRLIIKLVGRCLKGNRIFVYMYTYTKIYFFKGKMELYSRNTRSQVIKVNITNNKINQHHVSLI